MASHFTPVALRFLRGLAKNNDREWFEERRAVYERELKAPMLALVEEINSAMESFAPEHVRPPHKTMMRIYRDTRFSSDKRPYKRHIAAWWARRGMEKTSGAGFYLHVHPQQVLISVGVFMPERDQLLAIRRWLAAHRVEYRAMLKKVIKPGAGTVPFTPVEPGALTRMPKGFAADHPAGDLLRAKNWGVHVALPSELALTPSLVKEVVKRFRLAAPLVEALNSTILTAPHAALSDTTERAKPPRRALF
jgi:uncharacterized protein (TIGR02453 family)